MTSRGGGSRFTEEEPGVGAVAGTGAFGGSREIEDPAGFGEGGDVLLPTVLVEVDREEVTAFVLEHRIDADDVSSTEMVENAMVANRDEGLIGALATLDPWLVAHASNPLISACGRVAGLVGTWVVPMLREDVRPSGKQAPEERYPIRDRAPFGRGRVGCARIGWNICCGQRRSQCRQLGRKSCTLFFKIRQARLQLGNRTKERLAVARRLRPTG